MEQDQQKKVEKKSLEKELAAGYDPTKVEAEWYNWWVSQGYFKADVNSKKEKFVMVIPPPNVTGRLHIGHALMTAVEDALIRYHRMSGREALWVPGTDHAGIATQVVVEKKLMKERKLTRHDLGREAFIQEVWKWKHAFGNTILSQLRHMGASVDWSREVFTMDDKLSRAVKEAFIRMHQKGLIFRSTRLVNWCCALNSTISNIEVDKKEFKGKTNVNLPGYAKPIPLGLITEFAYKIVGSETEEIVVATTRPETMLGDTAVAVHPEDSRYTHLHGKRVQHPFLDRTIPIICDSVLVDKEFGTGVVKITPAHDPNDYECGKRHNLEMINILNDDGTMNHHCGQFAGMKRFDARLAVINALKEKKLWKSQKDHTMAIGICSRTGDVIEPILKPQWYVNTVESAKRALDKVASKELTIHPDIYVPEWERWLSNPESWCISRQLWWGHTIPAYYISIDGHVSSKEELPDHWVVANNEDEAKLRAKEKFGSTLLKDEATTFTIRQDPDVLDTWFSSSLFPFSVFGWPDTSSEDLKRFFPTTLLETGHDILFFWVAKMVMNCLVLNDCLPFSDVYLHAVVRDPEGEKMSKSKGNVIDPIDVITGATLKKLNDSLSEANLNEKDLKAAIRKQAELFPQGISECGTDALRLALCSYTSQPRNINLEVQRVVTYRHFCNKIWNAVKYVLMALETDNFVALPSTQFKTFTAKHDRMSQWILSKLANATKTANEGFLSYKLYESTDAIHNFVLKEFCDVYLESVKRPLRNKTATNLEATQEVQQTLYICIHSALTLLHPFMPFVTEELFQYLPKPSSESESICVSPYLTQADSQHWRNTSLESDVDIVLILCNSIRALRAAYNIPKKGNPEVVLEVKDDVYSRISRDFLVTIGDLSFTEDTVRVGGEVKKEECSRSTVGDKCEVYLKMTGLGIDFGAEKAKMQKKVEALVKAKGDLEKRMKSLAAGKVPEEVRIKNEEKLQSLDREIGTYNAGVEQYGYLLLQQQNNNNNTKQ